MKPNIKIIKEWVKALRSGKYKQCQEKLKKIDPDNGKETHCCLGVLCEIHKQHHPKGHWDVGRYYPSPSKKTITSATELPPLVIKFAGLEDSDPVLIHTSHRKETASELNDNGGYGFKRIASAIEKRFIKTNAYRIIKKPRKPKSTKK